MTTTATMTESRSGSPAAPEPTLEPTTTTEAPAEEQTFTVGTITITAASEEEALRKYKRLVRAEGLKAQIDNDWCDSGTNERLARLGLRPKGEGITVRLRVVAERTAYMVLDVDTEEEADEALASGEDPDVLALVTASVGRGWKALVAEKAPDRDAPYRVGDTDDTTTAVRVGSGVHVTSCETYSSTRGYCTRPPGHVAAGDRQHAVGNGTSIIAVWDERAPRRAAAGGPIPVVGETFEDFARGADRCGDFDGDYICTRRRGHSDLHAGAFSNQVVGGVWGD